MSLQTGQPLCQLKEPIINPYNLRIVAFYVDGPRLDFSPAVVFADDIREFGKIGAIVDSVDNVMSPDGMVRLDEIIQYEFILDGIMIVDEDGHRLGKVSDYIIDTLNFEIQQLYVKPRLWQSLSTTDKIINRRQIIKIEPERITVRSPKVKAHNEITTNTTTARQMLNPDFDNPFRKKPVVNNTRN